MSDMEQPGVKKKKKRLRKGRVFLLLILLIGILCGGFMAGMGLYDRFFSADDPVPKQKEDQLLTEEPLSSRINVLLLGKDDGDSEDMNNPDAPKRTDSMMVVSFDPEKKQIAIVGLPRDTRVTIPGRRGHDKINAAYAYGGTKRAVRTVEQLLQIPINYYMVVDWQGFIKVIDMLGGVDLYVDNNMDYEDPYANLKIHLKKGYQHLDGEKAGQYVRFRHDELGDIGRVERQQKFMKALAGQFFTFTNMLKLPMIINTGLDYIDTDMNLMTMIRAANCFRIFGENSIKVKCSMAISRPSMISVTGSRRRPRFRTHSINWGFPIKELQKFKEVPSMNPKELANAIAAAAADKKAKDILLLNMVGLSPVTDYFMICSAQSATQVRAIADSIEDKLAEIHGILPSHKEGYTEGNWILMDYGDCVAHIFRETERDFYNLEQLWADAPSEAYVETEGEA